ncbi:aromatic compound dioxygenase [Coniophora puteana RWD-64-598 SS2]|uniref:Aromatic compound dioxygenase n=1 Tax=Coniophora puteana (strain RWD-64-598) TaxID=741705 RepID=A0A5M3N3E2_CONPW|nr:aromatic compound dioxygenase [Coniophora puteana RWD-64-598 SS2]EIW85817.1 aromatic compound dioxygenase [Coniophora puteana RWD-64-598 SS2]
MPADAQTTFPQDEVHHAVSNGIGAPEFNLPLPDRPEIITANILKLLEQAHDPRLRFLLKTLTRHMHQFITETSLTTDEWMKAIEFLTRVGQTCTPIRQETILLSDVFGISALVDAINNPPAAGATESSVLGPFFTEDAADVELGHSIASEGKGEYMFVEGTVKGTDGKPIPNVTIDTWETDDHGFYDTQYTSREAPDCRGRLRTDSEGRYSYRAVVPVPYPIPGDGPVGEMLLNMRRHNMRPAHLHMMFEAPGYAKLVTAFYPAGDEFIQSDAVFGVKKSLVVNLEQVNDPERAKALGFKRAEGFKYLRKDIVMRTEAEARETRTQIDEKTGLPLFDD